MSWLCVCVSSRLSSSFSPASRRIFLIPKCRGSGNEKHSHKLSNAKVAQCEQTYRPCGVFSCCLGFFFTISFLLSSREHIHSYVRHIQSGDGRWKMWNMSSKRRQRRRSWNEEIKIYKNEAHAHQQDGTAEKVKSYELRKEWFVHKLGRRLNGIFSCWVIKTKQTAKKCRYHENNEPSPHTAPISCFHFSSVSHFLTRLLGMAVFSFVWFYGRVPSRPSHHTFQSNGSPKTAAARRKFVILNVFST